jgi:hypothetical protein
MQVLAFIAHYCCGGGSLFPGVGRSTTLDPFGQHVRWSVGTQPSSALQFFGYMGRKETERVTHTHTHTQCVIFCGFCVYGFVIQGVFLSLMKWVRSLWLWYYEEEFGSWWVCGS